ncbi:MAG: bifunctional diaminohydroxyphosphoribosylaminopyrimidine deaminase/5-amino-6-(5-phosphoribosylamino)uracil reductase RibD [Bacillota bacterium]|nr:bifunctional diaminohydroxyphosphoribosylaminopyrimidine deaminase/5-amino-6-(5-phosphoribosylamino)uracil reductase RibD [Bacillota bacterium]
MEHVSYMMRALELAAKGCGSTSPNPMVGSVIVNKNGEIVGEGYHQKAGTPHAEIHALNNAESKANGSTIYVNLEPCSHYGRTPPCVNAIVNAGIKKVVIGMVDPNPKVAGRGIDYLKSKGIEVVSGVMEAEAKELNKAFVKFITTGKPYVTSKLAMSLDGKTATVTGESKWITSLMARQRVHQLRHQVDAILVGINTVLLDDPSLTTRLPDQQGIDPIRIILDSKLRIPLTSKVLNQESNADTIIFTSGQSSTAKIEQLKKIGIKVVESPGSTNGIDISWVMDWLGKNHIIHVLIEGGSEVNFSAIKANIVNEFWWFYAPKIIGGKNAPSGIGGAGFTTIPEALKLKNISIETVGPDILVKGYPEKEEGTCLQD